MMMDVKSSAHILIKFGVEVIDIYVSSAEQKITSAAKL